MKKYEIQETKTYHEDFPTEYEVMEIKMITICIIIIITAWTLSEWLGEREK